MPSGTTRLDADASATGAVYNRGLEPFSPGIKDAEGWKDQMSTTELKRATQESAISFSTASERDLLRGLLAYGL